MGWWRKLPHAHSVFRAAIEIAGEPPCRDEVCGWRIEVVYRPDRQARRYGLDDGLSRGFPVIPRRWVVEAGAPWAGFAWLGQARRLSKDYGRLPAVAAEMIDAAMSRIVPRRMARTEHETAA